MTSPDAKKPGPGTRPLQTGSVATICVAAMYVVAQSVAAMYVAAMAVTAQRVATSYSPARSISASSTARAVMLSTSAISDWGCSTWTGLAIPCRIGPMTSAPPRRWTSL